MRKLILALAAILSIALPATARAEGGPFGLGLMVGSPTGISGKYYMSRGHAIDFGVGLAMVESHGVSVHADYLWHPVKLASEPDFMLGLYCGIGARLLDHDRDSAHDYDDDFHIGARAPLGLVMDFGPGGVPLDVFVEAALILDLILDGDEEHDHDGIELDLSAGLGVRYYF